MSDSNSTVRFCPKCNADTERNGSGRCKTCVRVKNAEWQANNKEKVKRDKASYKKENREKVNASNAIWRAANPEKVKACNDAWAKANPDKVKANCAAYRAANLEKVKEYFSVWYKENIDRVNATNNAWRKANPDKVKESKSAWRKANIEIFRVKNRNRRAMVRGASGTHTKKDIADLMILQKSKCACCKCDIKKKHHVDHITALINGGSNDRLNLQLLCPTCNVQKNAKHPVDFMQSKGFLL